MNLEEIKDLIKLVSKSGIGKIEIESEGFKIAIKNANASNDQPVYVKLLLLLHCLKLQLLPLR